MSHSRAIFSRGPLKEKEAADPEIKKVSIGAYVYTVTARDLQMEQQAFEAGEALSLEMCAIPVDREVKNKCDHAFHIIMVPLKLACMLY